MNQYLGLLAVAIGSYGIGYLMGKRQGTWNTLMNSTGLWGRPSGLKLVKGKSSGKGDSWKSLKPLK